METMCSVLLGKAETKGNCCGQTIVLEREEERNARRRQKERRKKGKVKHFLNLNNLPMYACTCMCVYTCMKLYT